MIYKAQLIPVQREQKKAVKQRKSGNNTQESVDTLARTIWGEARGESVAGREAVAAVVMNRVRYASQFRRGFWWGSDVVTVCRKPYQFSCWNKNDPNRQKLAAVSAEDPLFAQSLRIARRAVSGTLNDPTNGATHYHTDSILPRWALEKMPTAEIGRHIFYRIV